LVPLRSFTQSSVMAAPWGMKAAEMDPSVAFREIGVKGPRRELVQVGFCARVPVRAAKVRAEVILKFNMMAKVAAKLRTVEDGIGLVSRRPCAHRVYMPSPPGAKRSSCSTILHPP
jgi:hypothetical protein